MRDTRTSQSRDERRRSWAARLVAIGFGMILAAVLIAVAAGSTTFASNFVVPAGIGLLLAVVVTVFGRFFVPAAIFGAMLVLFAFVSVQLEIRHPESFETFVPALWLAIGALSAFVGAVIGIMQKARSTLRRPSRTQRLALGAGIAVLVLGSAASWSVSGASRVTRGQAKGALIVSMADNRFSPNKLSAPAGESARFYLRNDDDEAHTFTIDDIALDEYIGPRGSRLVSFTVPESMRGETLLLTCAVTGHEDMDGTVDVGAEP
jgi:hypothetical protein